MAAPIPLRCDFDAPTLRALAKRSRDPDQTRRLLTLAAIYDGCARTEAAQLAGVGLQIVRDWVIRFNEQGPDGLINRKAPGRAPILDGAKRAALRDIVEQGPIPAVHGVVRWRLIDLVQWVWDEFGLSISEQTLGRELHALGYRKLSARPRHYARNARQAEAFKKNSRPSWQRSRPSAASR
jgi:transposase